MIQFESVFEIGERVYYNLPDSDQGVVTDVTYRVSSGLVWYYVTFTPDRGEVPCRDFELSRDKIVV